MSDLELGEYIYISQQTSGIEIHVDGEIYELTQTETDRLLDDLDVDSIWGLIAEKTKCVRWLQEYDG